MNEEKYRDFSIEELIADEAFIHWVLNPDREGDDFWADFLKKFPEKKQQVGEAALIIRAIQPVEPEIPDRSLDRVFLNIKNEYATKRREAFIFSALKYAAALVILALAGFLLTRLINQDQEFPLFSADSLSFQKGRVIFSDGTYHEFEEKETVIEHDRSGSLMINRDTVHNFQQDPGIPKIATVKVIVPYGKISLLALSDGTRIWLNSGTQLVYPGEFKPGSREVYLAGEAFFDVAEDAGNPFAVVTENMKIRVTGTSFNVSSYPEDEVAETVLVDGKVTLTRKRIFGNTVDMIPGERVVFNRPEEKFYKDAVDVEQYTAWINEYLVFENTPVAFVLKKLERFYNRTIEFSDNSLEGITFSGKLDLKTDLEEVLEVIAYASTISVREVDGAFKISP